MVNLYIICKDAYKLYNICMDLLYNMHMNCISIYVIRICIYMHTYIFTYIPSWYNLIIFRPLI